MLLIFIRDQDLLGQGEVPSDRNNQGWRPESLFRIILIKIQKNTVDS